MPLFKAARYEAVLQAPDKPNVFIAWIEAMEDPQVSSTVAIANVSILRRYLPFAYILYDGTEMGEEVADDKEIQIYIDALKTHPVRYAFDGKRNDRIVIEVGERDISPFLMSLELNTCGLLLLPAPQPVVDLAARIESETSIDSLLRDGGAYVTNTDSVCFRVRTFDERLSLLFKNGI